MITQDENGWKIDRRIPIAVIATFFLQIAGMLIWATELDARVSNVEHQMLGSSEINEKFARLEERLESVKQNIESIKHQLDFLTNKLFKP